MNYAKENPAPLCQADNGENQKFKHHQYNADCADTEELTPTNLCVALKYAKAGLSVFPCDPTPKAANEDRYMTDGRRYVSPNKKPILVSSWPSEATTEESIIRNWWLKKPDALVGLPCGLNGLFVIDADDHGNANGIAAFNDLIERHGELPPNAVTSITQSGSRHYFFRQPVDRSLGNSKGALPGGLDVRGNGGYVIAPGTVWMAPDGEKREWFEELDSPELLNALQCLPQPSEWMIDLITPKQREPDHPTYVDDAGDERQYISDALRYINSDDRDMWLRVGGALHDSGHQWGRQVWDNWSRTSNCFDEAGQQKAWNSFNRGAANRAGIGTIITEARRMGFEGHKHPERHIDAPQSLNAASGPPAPIKRISATPFILRDPKTIPPREWVYGGHYIRSFISATVAAGGTGKSSLLLTEAVIMATGKALLHHPVREPVRVWYWCGEDPREEIERRLAAICLHFGITSDDLGGRLFIDSGRDTEIKIAIMDRKGFSIATPVIDEMIAEIRANQIDVVILDPMVSTHSVSENDNMAIDAVAKSWGRIAGATNCAIELAHHIRKTGGEAGVDDARGASALKDAARSVRVLNKMTPDEAASAGVKIDPRFFFRIDYGDKANMRPPSEKSEWQQMVGVKLGNATERLSGDNIGVPTMWNWPGLFDGVSMEDCRRALDALRDGEYRTSPQSADWAGHHVGQVLGIETTGAAGKKRVDAMLKQWLKNGQLEMGSAPDKKRMPRPIYVVVGSL